MIHFQPTHVSRGVMRAYGTEHPIGDPFGGAAYGELNGGGSLLGGLGGIGSIIGGIAVIASGGTLAPLIGGLMIAGGAMTSIGAVSGNKDLMKIGAITSAVGGVAGLGVAAYNGISAALAESSLAETAGSAIGEAASTASSGSGAAAAAGETMVDIPGIAWNTGAAEGASTAAQMSMANTPAAFDAAAVGGAYNGGGFVDQMTNALGSQISETSPLVADSIAANVTPSNMLASAQGVTDAGGIGSAANISGGFGTGEAFVGTPAALPGSTSAFGTAGGATVGEVGGIAAGAGDAANQGLLASVGSFIKENPMASMMGMQAISGLAQGASPKSQAEGEYLQAMTQLKEAEASYLQAAQEAKIGETQANTEYLQSKAAEFDKTKAYAEEKRKAYNDSIKNLQMPTNYVDYNTSLFNPTAATNNAGIINGARA